MSDPTDMIGPRWVEDGPTLVWCDDAGDLLALSILPWPIELECGHARFPPAAVDALRTALRDAALVEQARRERDEARQALIERRLELEQMRRERDTLRLRFAALVEGVLSFAEAETNAIVAAGLRAMVEDDDDIRDYRAVVALVHDAARIPQLEAEQRVLWDFVEAHDTVEDLIVSFGGDRDQFNVEVMRLRDARARLSDLTNWMTHDESSTPVQEDIDTRDGLLGMADEILDLLSPPVSPDTPTGVDHD